MSIKYSELGNKQNKIAGVSDINIGYLDGVTSSIQSQIDNISLTPGPSGAKGDSGTAGLQGIQGTTGETGSSGIQGIKGDTGDQGIQGTTGETGPGHVVLLEGVLSSDSVTITKPITAGVYKMDASLTMTVTVNEISASCTNYVSQQFTVPSDQNQITLKNDSFLGYMSAPQKIPGISNLRGIDYGNGIFIGTGSSSLVAISPDGINWTTSAQPFASCTNPAFGNGVFVVLNYTGINTQAAYSTDGIIWNQSTISASKSWNWVLFAGSLFFAFGTSSGISTSPDGINWTTVTSPGTTIYNSVAYGNNTYVVVSNLVGTSASSTDGVNWVARTGAGNPLAFANGLFVGAATATTIKTSEDGVTWVTTTVPAYGVTKLIYANSKFFSASNSLISTSDNAFNWESYGVRSAYPSPVGIAFSNDTLVLAAADGSISYTKQLPLQFYIEKLPGTIY